MILIEKQLTNLFRSCGATPDEARTMIEMLLANDTVTHSFGSYTTWPFTFVMDTWTDGSHTVYIKGFDDTPVAILKFRNKIKDKDLVRALDAIRRERHLTSTVNSVSGY